MNTFLELTSSERDHIPQLESETRNSMDAISSDPSEELTIDVEPMGNLFFK